MPNVPHDDPFPGGHFRVEIDGINKSNFDSVSGLTGFAQVEEYREGSDPSSAPRKEPGEVDYTNIVLRAGLDGNHELYDWWKSVADGEAARRNMSILLLDRAHTEVARWNVRNAVPVRYTVSNLDASEADVVIEILELAHEGISRE